VTMMAQDAHGPKMGSNRRGGEADGTVQYHRPQPPSSARRRCSCNPSSPTWNITTCSSRSCRADRPVAAAVASICSLLEWCTTIRSVEATVEFTVVLLIVSIPIASRSFVTDDARARSKELSQQKLIVAQALSHRDDGPRSTCCAPNKDRHPDAEPRCRFQQDCPIFTGGVKTSQRADVRSAGGRSGASAAARRARHDWLLGACEPGPAATRTKADRFQALHPRVEATEADACGCRRAVAVQRHEGRAEHRAEAMRRTASDISRPCEEIITDLGSRGDPLPSPWRGTAANGGLVHVADPDVSRPAGRPDTKATIRKTGPKTVRR